MKININYSNSIACLNWLWEIENKIGTKGFLGEEREYVVKAAELYDIPWPFLFYFAEVPLKGKPGVDLSVQYFMDMFDGVNPLEGRATEDEGLFLVDYAKQLKKFKFKALADCQAFLEADTSKGNLEHSSLFVNLAGRYVDPILPLILEKKGELNRLDAVKRVLSKAAPDLGIFQFGFMSSRKENPLRLDLYPVKDNIDGIIAAAVRLGLNDFVAAAEELLYRVDNKELWDNISLDLDIMPDGSLGDTVGVEFKPIDYSPTKQRAILSTPAFETVMDVLKLAGMADQRIELLPRCLFGMPFTHPKLQEFYFYSYLSHMKLVWKAGRPINAKVYLELRSIFKDNNINDSLARYLREG